MKYVFLIYPKRQVSLKCWGQFMKTWLPKQEWISHYVFHSRHAKVWAKSPKTSRAFPKSKFIKVVDQTTHIDEGLLPIAKEITMRSLLHGYSHVDASRIITHYLFNHSRLGYRQELKLLVARVKLFKKFLKSKYTARQDHGWEIVELKKVGYPRRNKK